MDKFYELKYHKLEENQWWFISRRNIILKLIKELNLSKSAKILEVGCSGGPLIKLLTLNGFTDLYGIDISEDAVNLCKETGLKNVAVMDCVKTQFNDNEYDLVIASDVLEHIENDDSALAEWNRILKPNGKLIVFVPAFNFLWSMHDEMNHHHRRYSKLLIAQKLEKANFILDRISYWNFSLFFPTVIIRAFQRLTMKKKSRKKDRLYGLNYIGNIGNKCLITILYIENRFLAYFNLYVGVSVFAICRKIGQRPSF